MGPGTLDLCIDLVRSIFDFFLGTLPSSRRRSRRRGLVTPLSRLVIVRNTRCLTDEEGKTEVLQRKLGGFGLCMSLPKDPLLRVGSVRLYSVSVLSWEWSSIFVDSEA